MGPQRQNALLGTGVDVDHCAFRLFEASIRTAQQTTRWRHCGVGKGRWVLRGEGLDVGKGEAELDEQGNGAFTSQWTRIGTVPADVTHGGTLHMKRTETAVINDNKACDPDEDVWSYP